MNKERIKPKASTLITNVLTQNCYHFPMCIFHCPTFLSPDICIKQELSNFLNKDNI